MKNGMGFCGKKSYANGGVVRGPGSGTSDSVKDRVAAGTYIMPADSTQAIGPENLEDLGFKPGAKAAPAPAVEGLGMGFKAGSVPVNLSDGEFKLSPDQVHAIGAQVLEGLKAATHTPAAQQEREEPGEHEAPEPSRNELFFADGGLVEDEAKKRQQSQATSPTNTFPGNRAEPTRGMYTGANTESADFAKSAFPGTATAIQGAGQAIQDAYNKGGIGAAVGQGFRGAMVPAVGLADDVMNGARKVLDPAAQALKTLVTGDATPIGQAAATAPPSAKPAQPAAASTPAAPTAPSAAPANPNYGNEPNAPANPQAAPAALANNVSREGRSYSGKDIGPGFTINGKEPGGGFVSGAAQPGGAGQGVGGPDVLGILQRENQIRAGMAPLMDQIRFNEGTRGNGNYFGFRRTSGDEGGVAVLRDPTEERQAERDRSSLMQAALSGRLPPDHLRVAQGMMEGDKRDATARYQTDTNAAAQFQTAAMREGGETLRSLERERGANERAAAANQIQQQEVGIRREAQGFQTAALRRQEALQARYEAAKTPEERAAIAQQIRDLSGKQEPQNRFTVVPGGQEWDAASGAMRNVPARVLNNQTGQFVDGERQAGAQPQAMPTDKSKLAAGQIYQTARGPARWDGNQFVGV